MLNRLLRLIVDHNIADYMTAKNNVMISYKVIDLLIIAFFFFSFSPDIFVRITGRDARQLKFVLVCCVCSFTCLAYF